MGTSKTVPEMACARSLYQVFRVMHRYSGLHRFCLACSEPLRSLALRCAIFFGYAAQASFGRIPRCESTRLGSRQIETDIAYEVGGRFGYSTPIVVFWSYAFRSAGGVYTNQCTKSLGIVR